MRTGCLSVPSRYSRRPRLLFGQSRARSDLQCPKRGDVAPPGHRFSLPVRHAAGPIFTPTRPLMIVARKDGTRGADLAVVAYPTVAEPKLIVYGARVTSRLTLATGSGWRRVPRGTGCRRTSVRRIRMDRCRSDALSPLKSFATDGEHVDHLLFEPLAVVLTGVG